MRQVGGDVEVLLKRQRGLLGDRESRHRDEMRRDRVSRLGYSAQGKGRSGSAAPFKTCISAHASSSARACRADASVRVVSCLVMTLVGRWCGVCRARKMRFHSTPKKRSASTRSRLSYLFPAASAINRRYDVALEACQFAEEYLKPRLHLLPCQFEVKLNIDRYATSHVKTQGGARTKAKNKRSTCIPTRELRAKMRHSSDVSDHKHGRYGSFELKFLSASPICQLLHIPPRRFYHYQDSQVLSLRSYVPHQSYTLYNIVRRFDGILYGTPHDLVRFTTPVICKVDHGSASYFRTMVWTVVYHAFGLLSSDR